LSHARVMLINSPSLLKKFDVCKEMGKERTYTLDISEGAYIRGGLILGTVSLLANRRACIRGGLLQGGILRYI